MPIEQLSEEIQAYLEAKYNYYVPVEMIKNRLKLFIQIHNYNEPSARDAVLKIYENSLQKNPSLIKSRKRKNLTKGPQPDEATRSEMLGMLRQMCGDETVTFHPGQAEAIEALVHRRQKLLLVQRTGWGKSAVYFISTKMLRKRGFGPTLIICPLLSLMRNQVSNAEALGLKAYTLNSGNLKDWNHIIESIKNDECDLLLISPERLSRARFEKDILSNMKNGPGLFVVDEAHCISDWGHDFRPDYKRIIDIIRGLAPGTPLLATTATANGRVVEDIIAQLGNDLAERRGPLIRENLRLAHVHLETEQARLAWLAQNLPSFEGSGIIYCLTKASCESVSGFLESIGIQSKYYHAEMSTAEKEQLEKALLDNNLKVLVSTIALGMGFDKKDLSFVIHYQMPQSLIMYYQQVGRAGRRIDRADAILLHGTRDLETINYFIEHSFPDPEKMKKIVDCLENVSGSMSEIEIAKSQNLSEKEVADCIKHLIAERAVYEDDGAYGYYFRSANSWSPNTALWGKIRSQKHKEKQDVIEYLTTEDCLMGFICQRLDDVHARKCGLCENCNGLRLPGHPDHVYLERARKFLAENYVTIEPHWQWADGVKVDEISDIPDHLVNKPGWALCMYGDEIYSNMIRHGKYTYYQFHRSLAVAVADMVKHQLAPLPEDIWITSVPSRDRKDLVNSFAAEVSSILNKPYKPVINKVIETLPQKDINNSKLQLLNIKNAFEVTDCPSGPVLLIDDMVDSGWTMAVCGYQLRKAGSGPVIPIALASSAPRRT